MVRNVLKICSMRYRLRLSVRYLLRLTATLLRPNPKRCCPKFRTALWLSTNFRKMRLLLTLRTSRRRERQPWHGCSKCNLIFRRGSQYHVRVNILILPLRWLLCTRCRRKRLFSRRLTKCSICCKAVSNSIYYLTLILTTHRAHWLRLFARC